MLAPTKLWFIAISHSDSGDIPTTSAVHNRAGAKTTIYIFNPNCLCGSSGRAMLAPTITRYSQITLP